MLWFLQGLITAGNIRGGGEGGSGNGGGWMWFQEWERTIKSEEVQTRGETDPHFGYFVIK